jgi:hypothetical protein
MTREKAIKILKQRECCMECVVTDCICNECDKAFEMAIKALEQAPDIDKVIATIDFEEKWLLDAGYNCSNVNTAFRSIKHDLRKLVKTND